MVHSKYSIILTEKVNFIKINLYTQKVVKKALFLWFKGLRL